MDLFEKYWMEYEGFETIKTDHAFVVFKCYPDQTCYLRDIYVLKESRRMNRGTELTDQVFEICKARGIARVFASIDLSIKKDSEGLKGALAYGFELSHCDGQVLWMMKGV